MALPFGATKDDLLKCKNILSELTGDCVTDDAAFNLLHTVYAKGGVLS